MDIVKLYRAIRHAGGAVHRSSSLIGGVADAGAARGSARRCPRSWPRLLGAAEAARRHRGARDRALAVGRARATSSRATRRRGGHAAPAFSPRCSAASRAERADRRARLLRRRAEGRRGVAPRPRGLDGARRPRQGGDRARGSTAGASSACSTAQKDEIAGALPADFARRSAAAGLLRRPRQPRRPPPPRPVARPGRCAPRRRRRRRRRERLDPVAPLADRRWRSSLWLAHAALRAGARAGGRDRAAGRDHRREPAAPSPRRRPPPNRRPRPPRRPRPRRRRPSRRCRPTRWSSAASTSAPPCRAARERHQQPSTASPTRPAPRRRCRS